mmetsp:Transcript_18207/g.42610  ORF Transcript_18207/g.42610 Transcript_18207/m.42610 type:complete len:556 (-) Transcript_18207:18-1685(-)
MPDEDDPWPHQRCDSLAPPSEILPAAPTTPAPAVLSRRLASTRVEKTLVDHISNMRPAAPDILRAVPARSALFGFGQALRQKNRPVHHLSHAVTAIDEFWSHSWHGRLWTQILTLLLINNRLPAFCAANLAALLGASLFAFEALPGGWYPDSDASPKSFWAVLLGTLTYTLVLLAWPARQSVFIDAICIDREDHTRRSQGLISIGAFLKESASMVLLWDATYCSRLWCVFEMAAFMHSRKDGERPKLKIHPTSLGPACVFSTAAITGVAFCTRLLPENRPALFWSVQAFIILFGCYACVRFFRQYLRSIETLHQEMRTFSTDKTDCYCCSTGHVQTQHCDREILLKCITLWFGSVQMFEQAVRADVVQILTKQLTTDFVSYKMCVLAFSAEVWVHLDLASAEFRFRPELNRAHSTVLRGFVWWLANVPVIVFVMMRLAHVLRSRRRSWLMDEIINVCILVCVVVVSLAIVRLEMQCELVMEGLMPETRVRHWWGMALFGAIMGPVAFLLFACVGPAPPPWNVPKMGQTGPSLEDGEDVVKGPLGSESEVRGGTDA